MLRGAVTFTHGHTVGDLFEVSTGQNLEYNRLEEHRDGVNFISRTAKNNGVSGRVTVPPSVRISTGPAITVALSGSVLASFLQLEPFVTAKDVAILTPKDVMSTEQLLFYCSAIEAHKWRFSYGRQANRTLKTLDLPDFMPEEWEGRLDAMDYPHIRSLASKPLRDLPDFSQWHPFSISEIFSVVTGNYNIPSGNRDSGLLPLVSASQNRNGISDYVSADTGATVFRAGTITLAKNGSVGEAFYQHSPFAATSDIAVLTPRTAMSEDTGIFIASVLRHQVKGRFAYGFKLNQSRFMNLRVPLPAVSDGGRHIIDVASISSFMDSLKWASLLAS